MKTIIRIIGYLPEWFVMLPHVLAIFSLGGAYLLPFILIVEGYWTWSIPLLIWYFIPIIYWIDEKHFK